jgi:hypothetical protein
LPIYPQGSLIGNINSSVGNGPPGYGLFPEFQGIPVLIRGGFELEIDQPPV